MAEATQALSVNQATDSMNMQIPAMPSLTINLIVWLGKKRQATAPPEQAKRQEAYARRLKEELKTKPTKPMNLNFEEPE